MASPALFNDPYDCSVRFSFKDLSEDQLNYFRANHHKFSLNIRFKEELDLISNETLKSMLLNNVQSVLQKLIEHFLKNYGVCCFTEINNDILMWGHYADSFKGFCLEFRTEYDPFFKLHQVKYKNCFPTFNILDLYLNHDNSQVKDLYCTKYINWNYEKEWRVLHDKAGTLFHYEPKCLKAIYFGPKIDNSLREIFCLILHGQNPEVELWQGELSDKKFEIKESSII
jgi:hypothetical protein